MTSLKKYFVWRLNDSRPWKCYGIRNHIFPDKTEGQLAWSGDDFYEGRVFAKTLNRKVTKAEFERRLSWELF